MNFFDETAAEWDNERRLRRAGAIADQIKRSLQPGPDWNAMEFGCGTGLVSFQLRDAFRHVTLIDRSEGMIRQADKKIRRTGCQNMQALCRDLTRTPWEGPSYQAIYSSMVLHHIPDVNEILRRLRGMLVPGGAFCWVDLLEDGGSMHRGEAGFEGHHGFSQEHAAGLLRQAGFACGEAPLFYQGEKTVEGESVQYSLFCAVGRVPLPDSHSSFSSR